MALISEVTGKIIPINISEIMVIRKLLVWDVLSILV
jgi:hypothetical protein